MKKSITIQLEEDMLKQIQHEASLKQISVSSCIRMLLLSAIRGNQCTDTSTNDNTN